MENNNRNINQLPDQNPQPESIMPSIELFPRFTRIATAVGRFLAPQKLDLCTSTHIKRSAAEMLDSELYDQVNVDGFLYDGEGQGSLFDS